MAEERVHELVPLPIFFFLRPCWPIDRHGHSLASRYAAAAAATTTAVLVVGLRMCPIDRRRPHTCILGLALHRGWAAPILHPT